MTEPQRGELWTGPYSAGLLDQALDRFAATAPALWITPSRAGADFVREGLARRGGAPVGRLVWTWEDLWAAVRARATEGPILLGPAGCRAVLIEAIERARRGGRLGPLARVAETPGLRRQLAAQLAAWTRAGFDPKRGEPPTLNEVESAEWAVFTEQRRLLKAMRAEGPIGFARWASRMLKRWPEPAWAALGQVIVIEPPEANPECAAALATLAASATRIVVTLPGAQVGEAAQRALDQPRADLIARGLQEVRHDPPRDRPTGLHHIERTLFGDHAGPTALRDAIEGARFLSGPQGEGTAWLIARAVRGHLEAGHPAREIVVLVPRWDDDADLLAETLREWGIPVATRGRHPLANDSAVAVLLSALAVPVEGWDAEQLARLLRNSRTRPEWEDVSVPSDLTATATALRESRAFRDLKTTLDKLRVEAVRTITEAAANHPRRNARRTNSAQIALKVLSRLEALFQGWDRPVPWWSHVARLDAIRRELGYAGPAIEALRAAIDDHEDVLERLDRATHALSWREFVHEVANLAREIVLDGPSGPGGGVRVLTVDEAIGLRVDRVILANLAEGTFPSRDVLALDLRGEPAEGISGHDREARRFLRVLGMARRGVVFVHPATDERGQKLLPAGFLEEVRALFGPAALNTASQALARIEQAWREGDFGGTPHDKLARAVAQAVRDGDPSSLKDLARLPSHRDALGGALDASSVNLLRSRAHRSFTAYEGLLNDPTALQAVAQRHGTDRPVFSASQLETLAYCPFKYFLRYVLSLEAVEERDELEIDHAGHGTFLHNALESLHKVVDLKENGPALRERALAHIKGSIENWLQENTRTASKVESALRHIEAQRMVRIGQRYVAQLESYLSEADGQAESFQCEVEFGDETNGGLRALAIGPVDAGLRLCGKIDRIDLVRSGQTAYYRVIDYKTGHAPNRSDVMAGLALQLPLYAWAAESLVLSGAERALPLDSGYWELKKSGFKPILTMSESPGDTPTSTPEWGALRAGLEHYLIMLVGRLRRAEFPVRPRVKDCTRSCDYRAVCRIAQVRRSEKALDDWPRLELSP